MNAVAPSVEAPEAARRAGISPGMVRRRYAVDPSKFQIGGRDPWRIPRERLDRFTTVKAGPLDRTGDGR